MESVIAAMQEKKLLDETSATRARSLVAEGKPLEQALVSADGLSEEAVLRFLADAFEIPYIENEYFEKTPPAKDFLTKFPKDELAPNAQYWLGETWYSEKKWNDAIVEFQKVLKDYKGSDKVPDALLKIGMSFQAQGDCQNATLFFEEVIQGHKSSPAAKSAHEKAAECRKARKGPK